MKLASVIKSYRIYLAIVIASCVLPFMFMVLLDDHDQGDIACGVSFWVLMPIGVVGLYRKDKRLKSFTQSEQCDAAVLREIQVRTRDAGGGGEKCFMLPSLRPHKRAPLVKNEDF